MNEQRRRPWILVLVAAGLLVVALVLLYVTAPEPTILTVRVVDGATGEPLSGASVRARPSSEQPLPIALSDETGVARFENPLPDRDYVLRVQNVDYRIAYESNLAVPVGRETEITVSLVPDSGGRLFVGLDGARVAVVDTASLAVVHTVRLPGWKQEPVDHVRFHPGGEKVYAIAGTDGSILDADFGAALAQFEIDNPVMSLDMQVDGQRLFAVSEKGGGSVRTIIYDSNSLPSTHDLSVLDAANGALISNTQTVGPGMATMLLWQPERPLMYALEPTNRLLWLLRADPGPLLDLVPTGAYPRDGFLSEDGYYLYTWMTDWFETLQLEFHRVMEPMPGLTLLPESPAAWTLSPAGERLYVLDDELGTLSILDTTGQDPPTVLAVGSKPVALVLDDGGEWAFVANQESKTISVIYLPSDTVILTIPLMGQPYSLAVR